ASDDFGKPVQLTSGEFDERQPQWAPDGSRIYYATLRVDEPYYQLPATDIYSVSSAGADLRKLTAIPMGIGDLRLSPDGRKIAFHGAAVEPVRSYAQPDVWVMDLESNAKPRNLTADYDYDMGDAVFGDNAP